MNLTVITTAVIDLNAAGPQVLDMPAGEYVVTAIVTRSPSRSLELKADGSPYSASIETELGASGEILSSVPSSALYDTGKCAHQAVSSPSVGLASSANPPAVQVSEPIGEGVTVRVDVLGYGL